MKPINLIILAGKTGSGKTTLANELCSEHNVHKCITATTRPPRLGEENNIDYYFYDIDSFQKLIINMELLEYVERNGTYYGTPLHEVINPKHTIKVIVLDCDGIKNAKAKLADLNVNIVTVNVSASDEVCIERLLKRKSSNSEMQKRIEEIESGLWGRECEGLTFDIVADTNSTTVGKLASDIIGFLNVDTSEEEAVSDNSNIDRLTKAAQQYSMLTMR